MPTICTKCKHVVPGRTRCKIEPGTNYHDGSIDYKSTVIKNENGNCPDYKEGEPSVEEMPSLVEIKLTKSEAENFLDLLWQFVDDRRLEVIEWLAHSDRLGCNRDNVGSHYKKLTLAKKLDYLIQWITEEC